jgi:hypothetical protein
MIRNLKVLGLAFVAVLAFGAVMASAASASFDSSAKETVLSGSQPEGEPHEFEVEAGKTECETAKFHSLSSATTTGPITGVEQEDGQFSTDSITIEPVYENCENNLLGNMVVEMNDCDYNFTTGAAREDGGIEGKVEVKCHEGGEIEVRATGSTICSITVPAQQVGGIAYYNESGKVNVVSTVSELKYTQHGVFCPGNGFASSKTFNNGIYNGSVLTSGEDAEAEAPAEIQVT